MPLAGFRCPTSSPTSGTANSIDHCLGTCPHKCAAPGLLAAIYKTDTENHHVGNYISASMLSGGGCPRQTVLERNNDFHEVPLKRYWSFRGTHAHSMIERAQGLIDQYGWLSEMRMAVPLEYPDLPQPLFDDQNRFTGEFDADRSLVVTIGGTCDSYNPFTEPSELWDLKSMADAKVDMMVAGTKPGTYSPHLEDSWVKQLNTYRWLISRTPVPKGLKKKLKGHAFLPAPAYLGIQGISMMQIPRTGMDYALSKRGRGITNYHIDAVPVWSLEETEAFIRTEAIKWYRWLVLGLPTSVVPKDKSWLCAGCAFNGERVEGGICFPEQERTASVEQSSNQTFLTLE